MIFLIYLDNGLFHLVKVLFMKIWKLGALVGMSWLLLGNPANVVAVDTGKSEPVAPTLSDYGVQKLKVGGDFTLTNQDGKATHLKQFRSRVVVIFFGYTYCPDVCPVTMTKMGRVKRILGKQSAQLQPLFVSIDPERDTPARLKVYLSNFDRGTIGLTGSKGQVDRAAELYRVKFAKEEQKSPTQYLMAHTAYLYMLDGLGKLRYVFPPDVDDALLVEGTRHLLSEP